MNDCFKVLMSKCLSCLILLLLPLVGHYGVCAADSARALLENFIEEVRTFEAEFKQTLFDQDGETIETWSGRFWMRRPGSFRWRYDRPYVQEIVGDGERIYQYDEELSQLIIDFQSGLLATAPTRFLFDRPALDQFIISDIGRLDSLQLVQLEDKRRDTAYVEFLLAFRDGVIVTLEMRDSFDQVTRISYENVHYNKKITDDNLRLPRLPDNTDVLDRTREESEGQLNGQQDERSGDGS